MYFAPSKIFIRPNKGLFEVANLAYFQEIMARIKYYYDTEKCKYERIAPNIWTSLLNLFGFLFFSFVVAVGLVFVYDHYFETPEESSLRIELKSQVTQNQMTNDFIGEMEDDMTILKKREHDIYRIYAGTDSVPFIDEDEIHNSRETYNRALEGETAALRELINYNLDRVTNLKVAMKQQEASYFFLSQIKGFEEKRLKSTPWITPIGKDQKYRVASGYGRRKHPVLGIWKLHTGVDYACKKGTPIRATGDGVVKRIGKSCCKGYGNYVDLDHGFGLKTKYGHMSKVLVKRGQKIKRGDIIGEVGSTGTSTGNHLHYEVIKNGRKINPVLFVHDLSPEEYEEMLVLAAEENEAFSIPEEE